MPTFDYTRDIPNAPNAPSRDQPKMLTITNSIDSIINVDHYSFKNPNGGWHKQITLPIRNIPSAPVDPASIVYTDIGQASTVSELRYLNANANYLLSGVKAFATFDSQAALGAVVILNGHNIQSVTRVGGGLYEVLLFPNVCTGNNVAVIALADTGITIPWTTTTPTITLAPGALVSGHKITFVVLQA